MLSKLAAGGLSAGVILIWWPTLFESDSATSWVLRGLTWTLMTEILLLILMPVEQALIAHPRLAGPRARINGLTARPRAAWERRRKAALGLTALLALSIPVGLVVTGAGRVHPPKPAVRNVHVTEEVTKVVRQPIEVRHETVVKRVPVQITTTRTVPVPVPAATTVPEPKTPDDKPSKQTDTANKHEPTAAPQDTGTQTPRDSQPEPAPQTADPQTQPQPTPAPTATATTPAAPAPTAEPAPTAAPVPAGE